MTQTIRSTGAKKRSQLNYLFGCKFELMDELELITDKKSPLAMSVKNKIRVIAGEIDEQENLLNEKFAAK